MPGSQRVLVYRTGHLGDTVCAIPAFRLLREHYRSAEITLLCDFPRGARVAAREVIEGLGIFEQTLTYRGGLGVFTAWELWRAVRAVKPDVIVALPQVRQIANGLRHKKWFFRRCGVGDVRGLELPTTRSDYSVNEPTRLIRVLNAIGIPGAKPAYAVPVNAAARAKMEDRLRDVGIEPKQPFLAFCGGGKAATQRWPLDRYTTVLRAMAGELGWPVVGLGSPTEVQAYRAAILPDFPDLRLFHDELSTWDVFELCRLARAYIGNDTGPMHVSASVGCPVAVVMSARNAPGTWDPDVEPHLVIRHRTTCEDCFLNECVRERHRCMTAITTDEVVARVLSFLRSLPSR
ncbi:MAG: glycosyltransferase family 9 protein [Planctomycetes bacterium]|nr:glycosyltransferase family 9 protein [Planctomycetota bacterium]